MNIPLNIDWQQILLHLFNFAILAGGLYLLLYKPVRQFMEKREAHYREMEEAAAQRKAEAEQLKADYEAKLQQAEVEIRERQEEARKAIQASTQQQLEEARQQAEEILTSARAAAERSREKAIEASKQELQDLAISVAEKLVLSSDGDTFDQFLDLAERKGGNEQS